MLEDDEQLRLETARDGAKVVVEARGELDIYTSNGLLALVEQLCADDVTEIELDGEGLAFVDSAGLRALVVAHERAAGLGVRLRISAASEPLHHVLMITGLDDLLRPGRQP